MNLLFLVEGKRTEKRLYKKWIPYVCDYLKYVNSLQEISENNFTIISGEGYPAYFRIIENAILDLAENEHDIDYLFICVDSEELDYNTKRSEIQSFVDKYDKVPTEVVIIIQNHCIETWLMGNKDIEINNTTNSDLIKFRNHYNVNQLDPEYLTSMHGETIANFTNQYLRLMLQEQGLIYSKTTLNHVDNREYFNKLIERFSNDNHINSFGFFYNYLQNLNS
ncbi:MAG: 2-dehydropantoate 2-reductase [Candidatus Thermoplasmatota archaeon]|nr:2-dehydropantoate 2-reductase [Candidatus Thermoplasmatota archaeon]